MVAVLVRAAHALDPIHLANAGLWLLRTYGGSVGRSIDEGVRSSPFLSAHGILSLLACYACALTEGISLTPIPALTLSTLLSICGTRVGQLAVLNVLLAAGLQSLRLMQTLIFGRLRVIEWQVSAGLHAPIARPP